MISARIGSGGVLESKEGCQKVEVTAVKTEKGDFRVGKLLFGWAC